MSMKNAVCSDMPLTKISSDDNSRIQMNVSELMSSIKQHGMLQPVGVVKNGRGYNVVFGNRRYAAAKKLKLSSIPVTILSKEQSENEEVLNLVENLQRENPNVLSLARYMKRLIDDGYQLAEVASLIDKPNAFVRTCLLAIDNVPKQYLKEVVVGKHGRKAKGIPLAVVGSVESATRNISKANKVAIYKLAKGGDYSAADLNKLCKAVSAGNTPQQAIKLMRSYTGITTLLHIHNNDIKKLNKHLPKHKSLVGALRGVLNGTIKETIRTI